MAEEPENFLYGINTKQEKAWQYLYAEYYSPLCCYALKILKDREYAMDVVQGIIVRLWEADTYFEDMPSFRGYLYRAVYHNCLKVLRDRNIKELCLTQCGQEEESAGDFGAVIEEEVVRKLRGVIARMPEKRREVMLLCLEEKTVKFWESVSIRSKNIKKKLISISGKFCRLTFSFYSVFYSTPKIDFLNKFIRFSKKIQLIKVPVLSFCGLFI